MAGAGLLDLPYEPLFQILTELLDPVVSFVFYSPGQTREWREDLEQYGIKAKEPGRGEDNHLPCTVSISMPPAEKFVPPSYLLVSHAFTEAITTIARDHHDRLHGRLSKCLVGETPYRYISQEPADITPEFLRYVASGRIVFAGHAVNTLKTIEDGIPQPVREAVTSVFCSRLNMLQVWARTTRGWKMNLWRRGHKPDYPDSIGGALETKFPALKKIGFAMARHGSKEAIWSPEAVAAMRHILSASSATELEVAYGEDDVDDAGEKRERTRGVGYSCYDWRQLMDGSGWFEKVDGETHWLLGKYSLSWKTSRVSQWEVERRGKYMDLKGMPSVEEAVVWTITGAGRSVQEIVPGGAATLRDRKGCKCHKCGKDGGQVLSLDARRYGGLRTVEGRERRSRWKAFVRRLWRGRSRVAKL